jgi:serine/threonine protein phosphatase 1
LTPSTLSTEIAPGDVIAVGDIHGRYDLFELFLEKVRGTAACVILLGDIIDRGGEDVAVLNKVKALLDEPELEGLSNFFCLMGNHEGMFVDACVGPSQDLFLWLQNGGNFEQYDEMQEHLEWIAELPVYMTVDDTMFIHAGIIPSKNPFDSINQGQTDRLLWMRSPFLELGPRFEDWNPNLKQIVFGHTPGEDAKPYTIPGGGVCIDSGAFFSDVLTSFNVTQNTFYQFSVDGSVSSLPGPVPRG